MEDPYPLSKDEKRKALQEVNLIKDKYSEISKEECVQKSGHRRIIYQGRNQPHKKISRDYL